MDKPPNPFDVLAFIHGYSSMPSDQWKARFPDWHDRILPPSRDTA